MDDEQDPTTPPDPGAPEAADSGAGEPETGVTGTADSPDAGQPGSAAPQPTSAAGDTEGTGTPGEEGTGPARRTRRVIHRRTVEEDVTETVFENLPGPYAPPPSNYPTTVG